MSKEQNQFNTQTELQKLMEQASVSDSKEKRDQLLKQFYKLMDNYFLKRSRKSEENEAKLNRDNNI